MQCVNIFCIFVGDISFEIKTEANSNDITEYPYDDMPSTGMFVFFIDGQFHVPSINSYWPEPPSTLWTTVSLNEVYWYHCTTFALNVHK